MRRTLADVMNAIDRIPHEVRDQALWNPEGRQLYRNVFLGILLECGWTEDEFDRAIILALHEEGYFVGAPLDREARPA